MSEPLRVLCVDDHPDAAASYADLLRLQGCEVRTATDGPAALTVAAAFRPDVCLLDLTLPGMDGVEVARRIREHLAGPVRLIAVTGLWGVAAVHRTKNNGFDAHLTKPVEPARLLEAVGLPPAAAGSGNS